MPTPTATVDAIAQVCPPDERLAAFAKLVVRRGEICTDRELPRGYA